MNALISARSGMALLQEGEQWFALQPEDSAPTRCHTLDVQRFVREADDLEYLPDTTQAAVLDKLDFRAQCNAALDLTLNLLDGQLSQETRLEVAAELDELLAVPGIRLDIESLLYAKPLPASADSMGALRLVRTNAGTSVAPFFEALLRSQPSIAAVRQGWDEIPDEAFQDGVSRREFEGECLERGDFRSLVNCLVQHQSSGAIFFEFIKTGTATGRNVAREWQSRLPNVSSHPTEQELEPEYEDDILVAIEEPAGKRSQPKSASKAPSYALKAIVDRDKAGIIAAMKRNDVTTVRSLTDKLLQFQLNAGDSAFACMTLCDLAKQAQEMGWTTLQYEFTTRAIRTKRDDAWSWCQHADALHELGRLRESMTAYDEAARWAEVARKTEEQVVAANGRAEVLKSLGRLDEALAAYDAVLREHSHDVVAANGRASVLVALGRFDEAESLLGGNRLQTRDEWINYHVLGMLRLRQARIEEAVTIFENGVRNCPFGDCQPFYRGAVALTHIRRREYKLAIRELQQSTPSAVHNVLLAHAHGAHGEIDKAADAIAKIHARSVSPMVEEVTEEIDRRFIKLFGAQHDDDWLIEREIRLLIAA